MGILIRLNKTPKIGINNIPAPILIMSFSRKFADQFLIIKSTKNPNVIDNTKNNITETKTKLNDMPLDDRQSFIALSKKILDLKEQIAWF